MTNAVLSSPDLVDRAAGVFRPLHAARLGDQEVNFLTKISLATADSSSTQTRLRDLLFGSLDDPALEGIGRAWRNACSPCLGRLSLSDEDRRQVTARLRRQTKLAPDFNAKVENMRQILRAAEITDPDLVNDLRASTRAIASSNARDKPVGSPTCAPPWAIRPTWRRCGA